MFPSNVNSQGSAKSQHIPRSRDELHRNLNHSTTSSAPQVAAVFLERQDGKNNFKLFTSSIPTLKPVLHKKRNVSCPPSTVFLAALQMRCKNIDTLLSGTPGILWLGTAVILFGWALQGYLAVGHCRDTLQWVTAGILCSWALQGYFVVGHCEDT